MIASKRKLQYDYNKKAKVGEFIICPICGLKFIKKQYSQVFDDVKCKDTYWNNKKDRHRKDYYHDYNMKHSKRLEKIGIYKEQDKIGIYDEYGNFTSFEEIYDSYAMCENPILGI